jgi:hypothetical protein
MKKITPKKLVSIFLYVVLAVTSILLVIFYFKTSSMALPDDADVETKIDAYGNILDIILYWSYGLLILALTVSVVFPIIRLIEDPKKGLKALVAIGIFGFIIIIAYVFSDGTPLLLKGYNGKDNVAGTLEFADTLLFTTYIMLGLAFLSIIYSEISKAFK